MSRRVGDDGMGVADLSIQLSRIESKLEVQAERYTAKLEEHGHRIGGLADDSRTLDRRLHELELAGATRQATIDRLREEAKEARAVADTKGNRGVAQLSVAVAAVALLLTVAQQLYGR